jgi:hypothetical protein
MAIDKTCKASQLVERLQKLIAQYGDLPVYAVDADTQWVLPIGLVFSREELIEKWPARFEIISEYYGRPEGDFDDEPTRSNP